MRKAPGTLPTPEHSGQHSAGGRDFYSPNPSQEIYDREFNDIVRNNRELDEKGSRIINDNADMPTKSIDALRQKETQAARDSHRTNERNKQTSKTSSRRRFFGKSSLKKNTSLAAILVVLLGGGSLMTVLMSPSLIIVQMKEVLTQDLNDQLHSLNKREATLLRTKLKSTTKGSCGVVKINCRFSTMNDKQVENFKKAGIEVEREPMEKGFLNKRAKVTSMHFTDPDTGEKLSITSAEDLTKHSTSNVAFRAALLKGFNPTFAGFSDSVAMKVLRLAKASKSPKLAGDTEEERKKNLNSSVANGDEGSTNTLRPKTDKDGKPTGEYVDESGHTVSAAEAEVADGTASLTREVEKIGGASGLAKSIGKVAGVAGATGAADTACTAAATMRGTAALAKVARHYQAIRFAMFALLSMADKIKAGDADASEVETVGKMMTQQDLQETKVDESKIDQAGTAKNPPMIKNPDYGKSSFDGPGPQAALGNVTKLDARASRFSLGWGAVGTLDRINSLVNKAVAGPNATAKDVAARCRIVQNPIVRLGSLGIGIVAGIGSFGLWTAAQVAGSLAVSLALPYLMSQAADIIAGKSFQNLEGMDFGDGAFVGTSAYMGDIAQNSGMKPLSSQEAVDYTNTNRQEYANYTSTAQYMARTTPFDIYNQYSFLGSITRSLAPVAYNSRGIAALVPMQLASFVPAAFLGTTTAKADNTLQRFTQCPDPTYNELGIGADMFCNIRFGLSEQELAMDPLQNNQWMADTGNIDPASETGEPKDNGKDWNYVKFLKECANRTTGWGEEQDENSGTGADCLSKQNESMNQHFRIYTLDRRVNDAMDDEADDGASLPGTTGVGGGQTGAVSTSGWAYPTTLTATMSQGYKGSSHRGVDLANDLNAPIFAARDGKVVAAGPASGFGNWIVIESTVDGKTVNTVYGHMSADGVLVQRGDTVKAGQQIGKVGNDGESEGPHLHFEIWDGSRLNPSCTKNGTLETDDCSINPEPVLQQAKTSVGVAV